MKKAFLILSFCPFFVFSQEGNNALSVLGGIEYHNSKTYAWDVELNYNHQFQKLPKWSSEFGLNFSILEFNEDSQILLDTNYYYGTPHGSIVYAGYGQRETVIYSRTSSFRIQAGVNHRILDKENLNFSVGLNVVNAILLRYKEQGQRVFVPEGYYSDSLDVIRNSYSKETNLAGASNAITIQIQPHVDLSVKLTEKLWFTSRLAYYGQLLSSIEHSRGQLIMGVRYRW